MGVKWRDVSVHHVGDAKYMVLVAAVCIKVLSVWRELP